MTRFHIRLCKVARLATTLGAVPWCWPMRGTCIAMTLTLLLEFGCGGKPLASGPGNRSGTASTGGNAATEGASNAGIGAGGTQASAGGTSGFGVPATGGRWSTGGEPVTGGHWGTGGVTSTGGVTATGGASGTTCTASRPTSTHNCGVASNAIGSFGLARGNGGDTRRNYYGLWGFFAGYAYVFISPTMNATDTLVCDGSSFGPSTSAVCGAGTVPSDCTYNTVGGIGFNLNQPDWGYGTSDDNGYTYTQPTVPISSPATVSDVTVTFVNTANSDLRIQIAQYSAGGPIYYCHDIGGMQSPLTVATSHFTRTCWDSANLGATWDGTGAQSIALIIPSQRLEPTPFDACIQNVELH